MRRSKSASFASGAWNENGRIALSLLASPAAMAGPAESKPATPAAAEAASTLRREGVDDFSDMIVLPDVSEPGIGPCLSWKMPAVPLSTHWSIAVAEHRLWYGALGS